ncbi:MAG: MarR family transcriptional regulator [Bacteroidales bacterium]|jgi:DNA-binding IscR family transcriptional regulator|nr:MarR family transcriptional regulator [Bacteroidales bacterium]MCK9447596.1 MarR family transcriptional regulator [Bacteroidales bacterium]MDD3701487.1 MarR family transcriptional regulator [Bacteroidales bacterium]MDY0369214.1 MarR family transcriptional regulator [Bacteroidales bacterium]
MDTKEKVLQLMKEADKAMRPGEIAEAAGIDKKEADKIIKALKNEELIYSPKRCFYQAT